MMTNLEKRQFKYRRISNPAYGVESVCKWNREWQEFVVTVTFPGLGIEGEVTQSTYHTDDAQDAVDTQDRMFEAQCYISSKLGSVSQ